VAISPKEIIGDFPEEDFWPGTIFRLARHSDKTSEGDLRHLLPNFPERGSANSQ
jgi:hypothetical protein